MTERASAELGRLIANWRKGASLSQAALADALGTQQATISKLETGTYKASVLQLTAILEACGLTLPEVAEDMERAMRGYARPLWERIDE